MIVLDSPYTSMKHLILDSIWNNKNKISNKLIENSLI